MKKPDVKSSTPNPSGVDRTRRSTLKSAAAVTAAGALGTTPLSTLLYRSAYAQGSDKPIRIGFQVHRTGIGALYGRWYDRVTEAAVKRINDSGGMAGRPVEIVAEDDGTDPKRGAEVVEKLATQQKVDFVYGTLFSHVVIGSAPRAGELKIPYFVVSEGYHVASGKLNRYVFQPGITDVRAQVTAMAAWVSANLGKKAAMIFPDYAFGYDHRDYFSAAMEKLGGSVDTRLAIPPTESSYTRYFPRIPPDTEVLYHVMVGPGVLTFVKEMGEHFGDKRPEIFGFVDSLEGVDMASPGLEFLEGTHFWEGMPRYAMGLQTESNTMYRRAVGIDANGADVNDPKSVSASSHMFGCWETLYAIKQAVETSGYQTPADYPALIETMEKIEEFEESPEHPQGDKLFNGKLHQCFGRQFVSKVSDGKLDVVHETSIEDGLYEPEADYTTQPL